MLATAYRRKSKKIDTMLEHSARRAEERYGLRLQQSDIRLIANRIRAGEGVFILRQSISRDLFRIRVSDRDCMVVYDGTRHAIRTFLPPLGDRTNQQYLEELERYFSL